MLDELLVLIVEDELKVAETLKKLIETRIKLEEKVAVQIAGSVQEAIEFAQMNYPDLVFLDIQMPEENGFDFLKQVDNRGFEVVFTTAHEQYAIEAINDFNCMKYLLKPLSVKDVQEVFDTYKERQGYQYYYKIIKNNSKRYLINVSDIILCKAADNYCDIYLEDSKYLVSKTLGKIEGKIKHKNFYRINRSHLINMDYVSHLDRTTNKLHLKKPILINGVEEEFDIIVSPTIIKELKKWNL